MGELELMSMMRLPGFKVSVMQPLPLSPSPSSALRTSLPSGSMVMTMSEREATSFDDEPRSAPASTSSSGLPKLPIHFIGLDNYKEFLTLGAASRENLEALGRTLLFCVGVTAIQFTFGLFVAILLNQGLRGTRFFRTLFFLTTAVPTAVAAVAWGRPSVNEPTHWAIGSS